jgi:hypothetical protein
MRTTSLELGSMWRSFDAMSYAMEKARLTGVMASSERQETRTLWWPRWGQRWSLIGGGCGEVVREGADLLCGHRGLKEEACHPSWRLWEIGLGSVGRRGIEIGTMGSGTREEGRR